MRVIAFDDENMRLVRDLLEKSGCDYEVFSGTRLVAVDVPPHVSYKLFYEKIDPLCANEVIEVEESCIQHVGM